jgi:hypothetical protein
MPQLTSEKLRAMGCTNVIGVQNPVTLLNEVPIVSCQYFFNSEEDIRNTDWFQDAVGGTVLLVCDAPNCDCEQWLLRAFMVFNRDGKAYDFNRISVQERYRRQEAYADITKSEIVEQPIVGPYSGFTEAVTPRVAVATCCPGCDGKSERNAMSGCHLPHSALCTDCNGSGHVTEEKAKEIKERHAHWDASFNLGRWD